MARYSKITNDEIIHNIENLKQLVFEVTDACNLRCKYCGYSELYEGFNERENLRFTFRRAKLTIDYLYNFWKKKSACNDAKSLVVIGFYGGEPLLNMTFIKKVIDYIENLPPCGKHFEYSMTTNAVLLDRHMDFLATKQFRLLISLDGNFEGQSNRIDVFGQNSFERVFNNIQLLRREYPDYFKLSVNFNSVIHTKNKIGDSFSFFKNEFGKVPRIADINRKKVRKEKQQEFEKIYCSISNSLEQSANKESLEEELFTNNPKTAQVMDYIYKHSGNIYNTYSQLLLKKDNMPLHPTGTCTPFSKKMFITVKGRILQCEKISHNFTLGNVTDEKVEIDIENIAQKYNNYVFKYIRQCEKCSIKTACEQCMLQVDECDLNSKCTYFVTEEDWKKRVHSRLSYLNKHPELYERILKEVKIGG